MVLVKSISLPETRQVARDVVPSQPVAEVVLGEGLRRHLNLKEMSSVRGAVKMVTQPQSLGYTVIDVDDPASGPLLDCPQSPAIFIYFGYSYY